MGNRLKLFLCSGLLLLSIIAIASSAKAAYGPKAYVTEYVIQNYWWNGTAKSADIRRGLCEVSVPNNFDVLQYVRVNTTRTGTDIQNMFYDNVVTSYPTTDSKDPIYANTTVYSQASYYNVTNLTASPTINISLSITNWAGGTNIYDSDNIWPSGASNPTNTLRFNLTIRNPSADKALTGVSVLMQLAVNTNGTRDAANITVGTNSSSTVVSNADGGDSDFDRITWSGNLGASGITYVTFNATLTENANINQGDNSVNLDANDKGTLANYSQSGTLSNIAINYKLARGSIRQGVDLQVSSGTWYSRGLIRNMANSSLTNGNMLTYNITAWRIYEVNPSTGAPWSSPNMSGEFNASLPGSSLLTPADGQIETTEQGRSSNTSWYNSTSASKPYIAAYFDWYVLWNDTASEFHNGYINTTMDMQTLYKVDMYADKALSGAIFPDTGGQPVTVNDTAYHIGSPNANATSITIYSIIPVNTTANVYHGRFEVNTTSIKVYYVNGSGSYELKGDSNVNWTATNPTPYGQNGTVRVSISSLPTAGVVAGGTVGRNLSTNEKIVLVYDVIANVSMTTGDTYVFTGNTTFTTETGTPESEAHQARSVQISAKRLQGYKDLFVQYPTLPTRINSTLFVSVEATGSEYIAGIKFIDYVLNGTFNNNVTIYVANLTVRFCDPTSGCITWTNGTQYKVSFNGTQLLSDGTRVEIYEFTNATAGSDGFILNNTQNITVSYWMEIGTTGTYVLPLQIAAFDPSTGESFSAQAVGVIRVDVPEPAIPLQITDHELQLAKRVAVGTPAVWIKNFEVYNPNARRISSSFQTTVFGDAMDGFVSYYNERGEKVEEQVIFGNVENGKKGMSWGSTLNPLETRVYEIRILTPPVMEIDRDIEVLEKLDNKMIKLKMDVFLKSFAEEKYSNVVLNLPIAYENVLEVRDGFGRMMQFTGSKDSTSIIVDEIEPMGLKTISVLYKASYPTIIITPDRDRYDLSAPVNLEILVINGGETIDYPYIEVEIYTPGMDVIYSNLERLNTMDPLEKTQNYQKFIIPANAPGGMYVASARLREDFTVLASTTGNFFVAGPSVYTPEALQIIAVLAVTLVLAYFSLRRLKEVRRTKMLLEGPVAA